MVAYIAGSISDRLDTYQYDFCDCEMYLNEAGWKVLSPAWMPIGLHNYEDYMRISKEMIRASDAVFFLEGWQKSKGAKKEHILAKRWKKRIFYYCKEGMDI